MDNETQRKKYKHYRSRYADDKQGELFKKFPQSSFLSSEKNVDHIILWVTFFRRNLHRFATDYLGIKLHLYQIIMLYIMGINNFFVVVASRASAKSFVIALYACCMCILYPNSKVVICSATKGQSKLIVSEKIQKELMAMSPVLCKEIENIKVGTNETLVNFFNHSTITVVPASDNARGFRSTILVREEFRMIKKSIDDSVLSPFQMVRQAPYLSDPYYSEINELIEESKDVYITSSWYDNGSSWMWGIVDQAYSNMMKGEKQTLLAFDESVALKHKIKTMKYFQTEKKKQDPLTWDLEFMNKRLKENTSAFFSYSLMQENQRNKQPFYPRSLIDFKMGKKNPYAIPKQLDEIRIVACDMAFVKGDTNDNSIFSCIRLLPETSKYIIEGTEQTVSSGYRRIVSYMQAVQGGDTDVQALKIRQLYEDFNADYIVLDTRNAGISIYDKLAKFMYDEERGVEYSPLRCMDVEENKNLYDRIQVPGAKECIYAISASQNLNSAIALDFKSVLESKKIDLLVNLNQAEEEILPNIKEYISSPDAMEQIFYEQPFLETQELISETIGLVYERKEQTGVIVIREQGNNRKDRYTSVSYGSYFATKLEKDLTTKSEEYDYDVFVD